MIEAEGLTKFFGDLEAVSDLSFRVEPGEILGLVGPNGAGKTTCLYMLSGLLPPTRGIVKISGYLLSEEPVEAKRLLGLVPDEPVLFDYLTVEEHLKFLARVYQLDDARERAARLLEGFDLADKARELPTALSRGFRQRMAICCALQHDPKAIFLDEPLTGLDPAAIRKTKDVLEERARGGAAVIISSHLLGLVEELCHRVLIIKEGTKMAYGSLDELAKTLPTLKTDGSLEDIFLEVTEAKKRTADPGKGKPGGA